MSDDELCHLSFSVPDQGNICQVSNSFWITRDQLVTEQRWNCLVVFLQHLKAQAVRERHWPCSSWVSWRKVRVSFFWLSLIHRNLEHMSFLHDDWQWLKIPQLDNSLPHKDVLNQQAEICRWNWRNRKPQMI